MTNRADHDEQLWESVMHAVNGHEAQCALMALATCMIAICLKAGMSKDNMLAALSTHWKMVERAQHREEQQAERPKLNG